MLRIDTSQAAWVRLYTTDAKRDADFARDITDDPVGDHGVIFEAITTDTLLCFDTSPVPQGYSMESTPIADVPYRVVNLDAATATIDVDLIVQDQET